jgi:hypothetical protein
MVKQPGLANPTTPVEDHNVGPWSREISWTLVIAVEVFRHYTFEEGHCRMSVDKWNRLRAESFPYHVTPSLDTGQRLLREQEPQVVSQPAQLFSN